MPAFVTHQLFGEEVCRHLPASGVKEFLLRDPTTRSAYFWGLQGPDLLFYHWNFWHHPTLPQLGSRMHKDSADRVLDTAQRVLSKVPEAQRPICIAYFLGFLCHYTLDRTAHPFIYFFQEDYQKNEALFGAHFKLESDIDTLLFERVRRRPISSYRLFSGWDDSAAHTAVASFYSHFLQALYGVCVPSHRIRECFSFAHRLISMAVSPCQGALKAVARTGEFFLRRPGLLYSHLRVPHVNGDPLNLSRRIWHPLDRPQDFTSRDFPELYQNALAQALALVPDSFHAITHGGILPFPASSPPFDNGRPREE